MTHQQAVIFARSLRDRGLHSLATELSRVADEFMFADALYNDNATSTFATRGNRNAAEHRLTEFSELCQRTIEDIANSPVGRSAQHVLAFGVRLEPHQAIGVATKLVAMVNEIAVELELL